jgi:hypothetical protein
MLRRGSRLHTGGKQQPTASGLIAVQKKSATWTPIAATVIKAVLCPRARACTEDGEPSGEAWALARLLSYRRVLPWVTGHGPCTATRSSYTVPLAAVVRLHHHHHHYHPISINSARPRTAAVHRPQPGFHHCLSTPSASIVDSSKSSHLTHHGGELPGPGGVGQYVFQNSARILRD